VPDGLSHAKDFASMKSLVVILCLVGLMSVKVCTETIPQDPSLLNQPIPHCQSNGMLVYVQQQTMGEQSAEFFTSLLDTKDWPPRWQCGSWSSFHGWLYILSDVIIWLSYFMIPITLGYFMYKRKQEIIPFRSVVFLFIAFILACGMTHLIDAAIFWWPAYRLSALVRFITASVSMGTVMALVQIAPKVIEFKSPTTLEKLVDGRTQELQSMNVRLQQEIKQREKAERKLMQLNQELEQKTQGLEETNLELIRRERDLIRSEEKIKDLNSKLERTVEERTRQLQVSNHELESFTYSVSHDLRAPLRAIDGYARILAEDYDERIDAQGRHLIKVITRNARYMGQLIDDLLEFSRTSRTELKKSLFTTDEEVRKIASELMIAEANRKVEINIKPLDACLGDVNMLRQVWTNLISNALKYTQKKPEARIEIGSTVRENEIEFYIQDNGVGFDMEYVGKLFGVFQRLHKKEEFEGTGVGLALVHRIMERHGGKIWAHAKLNEGATFYVSLPKA
jgi:signal transduction histidine kinase